MQKKKKWNENNKRKDRKNIRKIGTREESGEHSEKNKYAEGARKPKVQREIDTQKTKGKEKRRSQKNK